MGILEVVGLSMFCIVSVAAVTYSRIDEGTSHGYLTDCPGSWKPAKLEQKTLDRITISLLGPGRLTVAKWTSYNYKNIRRLAKHPFMDFRKKTILYVSGYLDMNAVPIGRDYGETYRDMGYNVLLMEAIDTVARDFPVAARLMPTVGKHVAEMLANLTEVGLDPKKLELLGLSLGGQTMSFIAKNFRQITGRNVSSLTALDPTGPCFRHLGPEHRLDRSDGDFVLMVATNSHGYGTATPLGHITFYVNGGEFQPGDFSFLPCTVICSHIRSLFIWSAALKHPNDFIAVKCDSYAEARDGDCFKRKPLVTNILGLNTDKSKHGIYYLRTSNQYPYALGEKGLIPKQIQTR